MFLFFILYDCFLERWLCVTGKIYIKVANNSLKSQEGRKSSNILYAANAIYQIWNKLWKTGIGHYVHFILLIVYFITYNYHKTYFTDTFNQCILKMYLKGIKKDILIEPLITQHYRLWRCHLRIAEDHQIHAWFHSQTWIHQ